MNPARSSASATVARMDRPNELSLLIVEDDPVDRESVIRGLRKTKIANAIETASDGVEALDKLRGTGGHEAIPRPLVILLDLNLPRMNGSEFLTELRADEDLADTIVFVLTTSESSSDIRKAYEHNVAGYIVKQRVGADFMRLVELLETFWRLIELPVGVADQTHAPTG